MKKLCFSILVMLPLITMAQSYHFSQFYSTPLLVNPAFTGFTGGNYRVATNYRSQWSGGGSPYTTSSLSFDVSPLRGKLDEGNKLGVGLSIMNDKSFEGAVQANSLALSAAYNLSLDADQVHSVGVGLQGVYNERIIDFSKLSFENQLTGSGFDLSLPIGETLEAGKRSYLDVNAGVLYNVSLSDRTFFVGLGVYNILQRNAEYQPQSFRMPVRYNLLGGGDLDLGHSGILYFSANAQYQRNANEITIGTAYGKQIGTGKKQVVMAGIWHRINDALIPYLGYELNGFKAGFSYDYTISSIKTASQVRNGFELSLLFTQEDKSELKRLVPWY